MFIEWLNFLARSVYKCTSLVYIKFDKTIPFSRKFVLNTTQNDCSKLKKNKKKKKNMFYGLSIVNLQDFIFSSLQDFSYALFLMFLLTRFYKILSFLFARFSALFLRLRRVFFSSYVSTYPRYLKI